MVTRSNWSMMILVILLLFFSNMGNCYASRPLSTMSNGVHVAKLVRSYIPDIGITPPPGDISSYP